MAIAIPSAVREAIYAHARRVFPAECCGYLVGPAGGDRVEAAVACRNAQADGVHPTTPERGADTGFVIADAELLAFARSLDGPMPARVVYHSHTNGRAYFSNVDQDLAAAQELAAAPAYPVEHLVIGVTASGITEVAQFAWSEAERAYVEVARWSVP
jgi:[CysO sulfur-carrier protein]-S-L-cysteine hydrolase